MTSSLGLKPCILPWINFCTTPQGRARPCGYSKFKGEKKLKDSTIQGEFNNEIYKKVRSDFIAGRWPENCQRCEYMENQMPGKSKKSTEELFYNQHHNLISQTSADGSINYFPKHIDIRLGTVCNLKCIHCGTGNSSKWNEDAELIGKYPNLPELKNDNSWVDRDGPVWDNIQQNIHEVEKFNFLGGEPFASRQHGKLIEWISQTPHAANISLQYVTNGTLLSEKWISHLAKFKSVLLNVSLDATGDALEFFRHPLRHEELTQKLKLLNNAVTPQMDFGLQWTSSNVAMFYLAETIEETTKNFPNLPLRLFNYVEDPIQMSPQNLPLQVKHHIAEKLRPFKSSFPDVDFYIQHMLAQDLWPQHGPLWLRYMEDLSRVRNLDWKRSLRALHEKVLEAQV